MGFFEDNFGEGSKKAPSSHRIQWEYKRESIYISGATPFLDKFNELGKQGWELCAYNNDNNIAIFKRPKYDYDE